MATGLWVFQWLYQLNKDEWYSTCWDAVISDTGEAFVQLLKLMHASRHSFLLRPPRRLGSEDCWQCVAGREKGGCTCAAS